MTFRLLYLALMLAAFSLGSLAAADTHTLLFFGDSLTAGYGLDDPADAYPGLIQKKITETGLPWKVVNAGLSGETTAGGLRRVDWILRQPVALFVLELGANDALRGLPVDAAKANLQAIIERVKAKDASTRIVLVGMQAPANLGADYTTAFAGMYRELADQYKLPLVPFLLEGVAGHPGLNQADRIHPTAKGQLIVSENVWKVIQPLL